MLIVCLKQMRIFFRFLIRPSMKLMFYKTLAFFFVYMYEGVVHQHVCVGAYIHQCIHVYACECGSQWVTDLVEFRLTSN